MRRLIVLPATRVGTLATMLSPAAKGATKITAARAARMSKKANSAVTTVHRALSPIRMIAQDGIQRQLILPNKRKDAVVLMPIFAKREEFRDGYHKTERFSVTMLSVWSISSSYSLEANASRGRARILSVPAQKRAQPTPATHPCITGCSSPSLCPADPVSLQPIWKSYLERETEGSQRSKEDGTDFFLSKQWTDLAEQPRAT